MILGLLVLLAIGLAWLQFYVRREIRYGATHFVRAGNDLASLPALERWTLAVVAQHLMPLGLPIDSFRPPESRRIPTLTSVLIRDWGVKDKTGLLPIIRHLEAPGHRVRCAAATGRTPADFLAWDLMRAILLAWIGLNLDWISRSEFEQIVTTDGQRLQTSVDNWEAAAASYQAGLAVWTADGKVRKLSERARLTIETLLSDPQSPWRTVSWETPLAGTIAE